jgi:dTMP kinase
MFISIEGSEGAGKTTLINSLSETLKQENIDVKTTREPGGTKVGSKLRELLLSKEYNLSAEEELAIITADRLHHNRTVIRPALEAGKVVITDRYIHSTIAYQFAARGLNMGAYRCLLYLPGIIEPDLTIYLDCPVGVGFKRKIKNNDIMDRIESKDFKFFHAVRESFIRQSILDEKMFLIDANRESKHVIENVYNIVHNKLHNNQ